MDWLYILDLFGTAVFAITGTLKAFEYRLDLLGVLALGLTTGIGGGTIRELLLGNTPPVLLTDFNYFYAAVTVSLIAFFYRGKVESRKRWFYIFDAIGLGTFTVIGSFAGQQAGLGGIGIGFLAILTAVGGGILRDVFVGEVPLIFKKEIYASAAIIGTIVFQILLKLGFDLNWVLLASLLITTFVRLAGMHFKWSLPCAK